MLVLLGRDSARARAPASRRHRQKLHRDALLRPFRQVEDRVLAGLWHVVRVPLLVAHLEPVTLHGDSAVVLLGQRRGDKWLHAGELQGSPEELDPRIGLVGRGRRVGRCAHERSIGRGPGQGQAAPSALKP